MSESYQPVAIDLKELMTHRAGRPRGRPPTHSAAFTLLAAVGRTAPDPK